MDSRSRILQSIAHKEPDKVPIDLGATGSSGISAIAYSSLIQHLNRDSYPVYIYDVVQQLAEPHEHILDLFGVDVLDISRVFHESADWVPTLLSNGDSALYPKWFKPEKQDNGDWIAHNQHGQSIARMPAGATFFDQTVFPWSDGYPDNMNDLDDAMSKVMWSAFAGPPWDKADQPDFWKNLREGCLALKEQTDKALLMGVGCNLFEWGTFIRRMDNFLMDLYLEPAQVDKFLDALMEKHMETLAKVCESVGDIVDIIKFGDDLGTMNGPFMDPQTYRTIFKPRHKMLCDYTKKNSTAHTFLHSCGSIYQLMPDLIDAGFEVFNPVQTQCMDMAPEKIKSEFGKEITIWGGGIETAGTLNTGTEDDVRKEVLNRLEILSKGGGFVFNTVHNILPDVPPQNIVAMFNAVKEFNGDPDRIDI